MKFTPEEGEIAVKVHSENKGLKISVTNVFGPLSETELTGIFEPFYRIDKSSAKGSGLGLAITKKIIERHGGTINACNSKKGLEIKGSQ